MSAVTKHEKPGVYSSYEASSLTAATAGGGNVAVVAALDKTGLDKYYQWTSFSRAAADVGDCLLSRMAQIAIRNGAGVVYGIPAGEDYDSAFVVMAELEDVGVVVCDSAELSVQQALKTAVQECSAARRERIAVVGGGAGETAAQLIQRAAALNSERMVLVAPGAGDGSGGALGGAQLYGLEGLEASYDDGDIDLLVQGGVTPLETLAGACYVVRGVTTRTKTGGAVDATWRELTTILVVDEVIPGIRNALRSKFGRAKNTAQSRGAIRSLVVMELEKRVGREIIDSYEDVTVSALDGDPTVCLVEFAFTVAHGLNQVWLSAHITV